MPIPTPKRSTSVRNSLEQRTGHQKSGNNGDSGNNQSGSNDSLGGSVLASNIFHPSALQPFVPTPRITGPPLGGAELSSQSVVPTPSLYRSNTSASVSPFLAGGLISSGVPASGDISAPLTTAITTPLTAPSRLRLSIPNTSNLKLGGVSPSPTKSGLGSGAKGFPAPRLGVKMKGGMILENKKIFSEREYSGKDNIGRVGLDSFTVGSFTSESTNENSFGSGISERISSGISASADAMNVSIDSEELRDTTADETEVDELEAHGAEERETSLGESDNSDSEDESEEAELDEIETEIEAKHSGKIDDGDVLAPEAEQKQEPEMDFNKDVESGEQAMEKEPAVLIIPNNGGSTRAPIGPIRNMSSKINDTQLGISDEKSSGACFKIKDRNRGGEKVPSPLSGGKAVIATRGTAATTSNDSSTAKIGRRGSITTPADKATVGSKRMTTAPSSTAARIRSTSTTDKKYPSTTALNSKSTLSRNKPAAASHTRSGSMHKKPAKKQSDPSHRQSSSPNQNGEHSSSATSEKVRCSSTRSSTATRSKPAPIASTSSKDKPKIARGTDAGDKDASSTKSSRKPTKSAVRAVTASHNRAQSEPKVNPKEKDGSQKEKVEKKDSRPPFTTLQKDFTTGVLSNAPPPPQINNSQALAVDASTLQKQTHLLQLMLLHDTAIESFQKFHTDGHRKLKTRWDNVVKLHYEVREEACELERKKQLVVLAAFFDSERKISYSLDGGGSGTRRSSSGASIASVNTSDDRRKTLTGSIASPIEERIQSFSEGSKKLDSLARSTEIKKIRNAWEGFVKGRVSFVSSKLAEADVSTSQAPPLPLSARFPHPSHLNPPPAQFNQMLSSFIRKLDSALQSIDEFRTYMQQQATAPVSEGVQGLKESKLWRLVEGYWELGVGLKAEVEEIRKLSGLFVNGARGRVRETVKEVVAGASGGLLESTGLVAGIAWKI